MNEQQIQELRATNEALTRRASELVQYNLELTTQLTAANEREKALRIELAAVRAIAGQQESHIQDLKMIRAKELANPTAPQSEQWLGPKSDEVCDICDGGPGNSCSCACGHKAFPSKRAFVVVPDVPEHPEPEYRELEPGEVIQAGDELICQDGNTVPASSIGDCVGWDGVHGLRYRRPHSTQQTTGEVK